jgi:hypothetical protein
MMSVVLEEGRRGLFIAKGERGDDAPPVLIDSCILISLPPPLKGWQVVIPIEKLERKGRLTSPNGTGPVEQVFRYLSAREGLRLN